MRGVQHFAVTLAHGLSNVSAMVAQKAADASWVMLQTAAMGVLGAAATVAGHVAMLSALSYIFLSIPWADLSKKMMSKSISWILQRIEASSTSSHTAATGRLITAQRAARDLDLALQVESGVQGETFRAYTKYQKDGYLGLSLRNALFLGAAWVKYPAMLLAFVTSVQKAATFWESVASFTDPKVLIEAAVDRQTDMLQQKLIKKSSSPTREPSVSIPPIIPLMSRTKIDERYRRKVDAQTAQP